jgi:hypothetical protein
MGAPLELADALLADPQVPTELLERVLGASADPVEAFEDAALAPVQPAEHPLDRCPAYPDSADRPPGPVSRSKTIQSCSPPKGLEVNGTHGYD